MKEKMLVKMDRDKLRNETEDLTKTIKNIEKKFDVEKGDDDDDYDIEEENDVVSIAKMKHTTSKYEETAKAKKKKQVGSKIPKEDEENPYLTTTFDPFPSKNVNPVKGTKAHDMPVTALAIHPRKPFIATGSDDTTWKIWAIPSGEMIVQGKANEHKDWISDLEFSPNGIHMATSSGDSTVVIWDFVQLSNIMTFKDHVKPVWSISYHYSSNFIVTGSMDMSSRLLDVKLGKAV